METLNRNSSRRTTDFDARIGQNLRALRLRHGLSQEALGTLLGVTFQQVQKYENGANRLPVEKLYRLHRHFRVPCEYFFHAQAS